MAGVSVVSEMNPTQAVQTDSAQQAQEAPPPRQKQSAPVPDATATADQVLAANGVGSQVSETA